MKAQFTVISGSRAGQIDVFGQPQISIGRHPQCELKFDADLELEVSSRHATVTLQDGVYVLRDLDSTNGTFVNGNRIQQDHLLANQDVVQFGANGPKVQFTMLRDTPAQAPSVGPIAGTQVYPGAPSPASTPVAPPVRETSGSKRPPQRSEPPVGPPPPRSRPAPGSTTTRVKAEVARQTAHLRRTTLALFGLLLLVSGAYFWQTISTGRQLEHQRRMLLSEVDSLMGQIGDLSANAKSLQGALDSARVTTNRLRQELAHSSDDPGELEEIKSRLAAAVRQQQNLSMVARLDAAAINAANEDAIGLVFAQFQNGKTFTGTAFAVRSEATGGFLITNRHVVTDSNGNRPFKLGIVFNGSNQNFRAEVVSTHPREDVALLHVTVTKGVPVVKGLASEAAPLKVGDPVAVIGFPLGLDLPMGGDWTNVGVASTLTLGTASKIVSNLIQLDSYGAEGASGSPIFNREGKVVGIVYGGQRGSNGRIVFGVPIRVALELLGSR
jgi:S1-C subfamily serine protease